MMHGREKSDPAIVATKPSEQGRATSGGAGGAKGGAEGNADQRRTRRAQDRTSVSQALGRVRRAARPAEEGTVTALFHTQRFPPST